MSGTSSASNKSSQPADDPWALAQKPGYSQNKFYTRSRDEKGFWINVQIPLSPNVVGEINALIAAKTIPDYNSIGAFFRDSGIHRLKYLLEAQKLGVLAPSVDRAVEEEMMMAQLEAADRVRASRQTMLGLAESTMKALYEAGDYEQLDLVAMGVELQIPGIPEPWKTRLTALVGEHNKFLKVWRQQQIDIHNEDERKKQAYYDALKQADDDEAADDDVDGRYLP